MRELVSSEDGIFSIYLSGDPRETDETEAIETEDGSARKRECLTFVRSSSQERKKQKVAISKGGVSKDGESYGVSGHGSRGGGILIFRYPAMPKTP